MDTSLGTGFAIVMAIVLVVVIIYGIVKLKKQVKKAEDDENRKSAGNLNKNKNLPADKDQNKI